MVAIDVVRSTNSVTVKRQPLVAVFVGGTSGIGEYTLRALAARTKESKGLRIYVVGRNESSANKITAECLKICPGTEFHFVKANDLSLLRDVDRVCTEIIQAEQKQAELSGGAARIDFLVQTQAYLSFESRNETKEGLDTLMSLLFYSRARFATQLLPLLLQSEKPATVVSVFAPNRDASFNKEDISLRHNYSFSTSGSHVAYLMTFYMEYLAAQNPGKLALCHYYPGLVKTNAFADERLPTWFKIVFKVLSPVLKLIMVSAKDNGERVLFMASSRFPARNSDTKSSGKLEIATSSDGVVGGGAYKVNWNGEIIATPKSYKKLREEGMAQKCVDHTLKAFEVISAGGVFTE